MINNRTLWKAHIQRNFFVGIGKRKSPTPISIGTRSGMEVWSRHIFSVSIERQITFQEQIVLLPCCFCIVFSFYPTLCFIPCIFGSSLSFDSLLHQLFSRSWVACTSTSFPIYSQGLLLITTKNRRKKSQIFLWTTWFY